MRHRTPIAWFSASLLASLLMGWLVFFAWSPVRPLATLHPAEASSQRPAAFVARDLERANEPGEVAVEVVPPERRAQRSASPERVEVRSAPPASLACVRVHGRVTRRGTPVPDFDLLFQVAGTGADEWEEWDFTDDDGAFEVLLEPGSYLVRNDDDGPWITNFVVGAGEEEHVLDIALPLGSVRGRVVRGETGAPVANATVYGLRSVDERGLTDALTEGLMARGGETSTKRDGSFELVDLFPGDYRLVAEHENRSTTPLHVVVTNAPLEELVLRFQPGYTLKGVVRGPGNEPVAMELRMLPAAQATSLTQLELSGEHYSNYDGEFVIEGLQPGPHILIGRGETRTHDLALQAAIDFRPEAGAIEVLAERCGSLVITILRSDGAPARGAGVDLRAHDGSVVLPSLEWLEEGPLSDAEGRIELDDVLPGWYRVAAGAGVRVSAARPAEVRSEETTRIELVVD